MMPTTFSPSSPSRAPTSLSAVSLRASYTDASGAIDQMLYPFACKTCFTVVTAPPPPIEIVHGLVQGTSIIILYPTHVGVPLLWGNFPSPKGCRAYCEADM